MPPGDGCNGRRRERGAGEARELGAWTRALRSARTAAGGGCRVRVGGACSASMNLVWVSVTVCLALRVVCGGVCVEDTVYAWLKVAVGRAGVRVIEQEMNSGYLVAHQTRNVMVSSIGDLDLRRPARVLPKTALAR